MSKGLVACIHRGFAVVLWAKPLANVRGVLLLFFRPMVNHPVYLIPSPVLHLFP
jgi:hypothetical protein